jgi:hypothetical protein
MGRVTNRCFFQNVDAEGTAQETPLALPYSTRACDDSIAKQVQEGLVRQLDIFYIITLITIEHAPEQLWVRDDQTRLMVLVMELDDRLENASQTCNIKSITTVS